MYIFHVWHFSSPPDIRGGGQQRGQQWQRELGWIWVFRPKQLRKIWFARVWYCRWVGGELEAAKQNNRAVLDKHLGSCIKYSTAVFCVCTGKKCCINTKTCVRGTKLNRFLGKTGNIATNYMATANSECHTSEEHQHRRTFLPQSSFFFKWKHLPYFEHLID